MLSRDVSAEVNDVCLWSKLTFADVDAAGDDDVDSDIPAHEHEAIATRSVVFESEALRSRIRVQV